MSFEIVAVSSIAGVTVFFAYCSLNMKIHPHLRLFMTFMSFFMMLLLINQARIIAEDSVSNTNIDVLISTTYAVMIWYFLFISSCFLVVQLYSYFKNGKISNEENTERTR